MRRPAPSNLSILLLALLLATAALVFRVTDQHLDLLQSRGIVVFGADLWASDWNEMTPEQELKLVTERLAAAGKGIILFHDPKARTAAIMPAFLRYLRENGYRVVHVVPAGTSRGSRTEPPPRVTPRARICNHRTCGTRTTACAFKRIPITRRRCAARK